MSGNKSKWAGAIREWCAHEITTDYLWWRWDVVGIDRRGEFVQLHFFDKVSPRSKAISALRKRGIAALRALARKEGITPIHGVLELPQGAHKARFL